MRLCLSREPRVCVRVFVHKCKRSVHSGGRAREMQRASSSNGPYSKSKEFQKESALRALGFELCLCKAGCPPKKKKKEKGRKKTREGDILNPEFAFLEGGEHNGGNKEQTDGGGREFTQRAGRGGKELR